MSSKRAILIIAAIALLNGCSVVPIADGRDLSPSITQALVTVFFATDRNLTSKRAPSKMFGAARANISYGECIVSIPGIHQVGELESPSLWRLEFQDDTAKHIVLSRITLAPKDKFFSDVTMNVLASKTRSTFLFVHGYNVSFADAARRTAQIKHDLLFDGAAVFYSWPSQGVIPAYTIDEQEVAWAEANLKTFLEDYFMRSHADNIYLIAHSMGSRALTRAIVSLLKDKPDLRSRLKEVILSAPDIDAGTFKRDIAPALKATDSPVTLYTSSTDLALLASKKVHGRVRAGDSTGEIIIVPGVETVDATFVDTDFLGHSYFISPSILSDMFYLVRHGKRADDRFSLRGIDTKAGRYWEFRR